MTQPPDPTPPPGTNPGDYPPPPGNPGPYPYPPSGYPPGYGPSAEYGQSGGFTPPGGGGPAIPGWPSGFGLSVPPGMYYDQASGVVLPNGVALASTGRRIGGVFLRLLLIIVTLGIGYFVWAVIVWSQGLDPAKQLLGMRCYRPAEGRPASWGYMALRNVVGGIIEGLSVIIEIVSLVMMLASRDHRAIHDHIGGTVVVYDPGKVLAPR